MSESSVTFGDRAAGFQLGLRLGEAPLRAGHLFPLLVILKNVSEARVHFGVQSLWFDYDYELIGPDGQAVPLTRYGQEGVGSKGHAAASLETLEAGEELIREVPLNRICDMSVVGDYRLSVARVVPGPNGEWLTLRSSVIAFELMD